MTIALFVKNIFQNIANKTRSGITNGLNLYKKIQKRIRPKKLISILFACKMIHSLGLKNLEMHFVDFLNTHAKDLFKLAVLSGVFANTGIDEWFSQFWRDRIRPIPGVNRMLQACKSCGEYGMHLACALFLAFILREKLTTTKPEALEKWTTHSLLNFASCTLIQAIGCVTLGGGRPAWKKLSLKEPSLWRPVLYFKELMHSRYFLKKRALNPERLPEKNREAQEPLKWQEGRAISGHAAVSAFTATLGIEVIKYFMQNDPHPLNEPISKSALIFSTTAAATLGAIGCSLSRINGEEHYLSQVVAGSILGSMAARHG
jgi:hypothetical protein